MTPTQGTSSGIPFVQARHYYVGRTKRPRLVVIHTMESAEKPGTARAVAGWFAGQDAPQASAHYCIDDTETVQCVHEQDTAWAAPGANADGIQLEHAGTAGQSASGWGDTYSRGVLARSAALAAGVAARWGIPVRHLSNDDLAAGKAGFIGHVQASQVYRKSDHTDPGPAFPWDDYLQMAATSGPSTIQEADVPLSPADLAAVRELVREEINANTPAAVWRSGWPAPTPDDPKHVEYAQDRLVWAARGSGVAGTLDTILGMLRSGQQATLSDQTVQALADAVAARVPAGQSDPAGVAHAVRVELAAALAQQ